jgi:hypothetical protein
MRVDLDRVRANVRQATTEDLLDRATVYRAGMEPEALDIIDEELRKRKITAVDIAAHAEQRQGSLMCREGWAVRCHRCQRPAVAQARSWHRLWGVVPLFPRLLPYCEEHLPRRVAQPAAPRAMAEE